MRELLRQLRERNVIKVGLAYLVGAWLVLQLADVIFPAMRLPEWSISLVLALLAVGFPLALILSWVYDLTPEGLQRSDRRTASAVERGGQTVHRPSIAVLPFDDMSAEKDQEHFCDGLTDELLNVLTRIPNLRVASRTSSFSFKGKTTELQSAAERLQVAHILEGSVRKFGNRIRVTAQLIEVATDSHLWSATYDRELNDIFVIQDDIAARILEALQGRLSADALPDRTTENPKAYEYFLRGRGYAIAGGNHDLEYATDMFRRAVEIDPGFLRAWIQLAEHSATYAIFYSIDHTWRRLADEAASRTMQLAPGSAAGYVARGHAQLANQRFTEAEADFRKAVQIEPGLGRAYHHLARAQYHQGKIAEATENFARATERDPDDFESPLLSTTIYDVAGNHDAARHTAEIGVARAEAILKDYPDNQRAYYLGAGGLYVLKQHERAHEWIGRALALNPDDPGTRYNAACFFTKYGETDKALDCLENSVVSRSWIENDPDLDGLRTHPRYAAMLATLSG